MNNHPVLLAVLASNCDYEQLRRSHDVHGMNIIIAEDPKPDMEEIVKKWATIHQLEEVQHDYYPLKQTPRERSHPNEPFYMKRNKKRW
jgi:hypothetical protein